VPRHYQGGRRRRGAAKGKGWARPAPGCTPMHRRLSPYASQAATRCMQAAILFGRACVPSSRLYMALKTKGMTRLVTPPPMLPQPAEVALARPTTDLLYICVHQTCSGM